MRRVPYPIVRDVIIEAVLCDKTTASDTWSRIESTGKNVAYVELRVPVIVARIMLWIASRQKGTWPS